MITLTDLALAVLNTSQTHFLILDGVLCWHQQHRTSPSGSHARSRPSVQNLVK